MSYYSFYIYKNKYYRVEKYIPMCREDTWHIEPIMNRRERRKLFNDELRECKKGRYPKKQYDAYLSEREILQKFDCSFERREKLKKLNEISNRK